MATCSWCNFKKEERFQKFALITFQKTKLFDSHAHALFIQYLLTLGDEDCVESI